MEHPHPTGLNSRPAYIKQTVDASLKRLRVGTIELKVNLRRQRRSVQEPRTLAWLSLVICPIY
jgi:aryl-alcohol dehydrogenase-like predicted oxidoreductase